MVMIWISGGGATEQTCTMRHPNTNKAAAGNRTEVRLRVVYSSGTESDLPPSSKSDPSVVAEHREGLHKIGATGG